LVPILVDTVPIFPPVDLESSDQCFLEFTPPQKVIIVDIENDVGDKIIPNLNLKISRKMLEKSKYAVTLTDVSSFSKLRVDLSFILSGGEILNTCISSKVMLDSDVHSRLALYVFIDKIMNANTVIFREIKSNNIIFKASGVEYSESKENLRNTINFYKKIVFIQDQLKITFEIPEKIYRDDEKIVNQLFDILKDGYTIDENIGFNLKDIENKITDFDALIENKTEILFQCNIIYMHLFNRKIEFNRDFFYIVPKALISVKENGNYSLVPQAKVIMLYEPVYKDFEINDVIDKHKKELGL